MKKIAIALVLALLLPIFAGCESGQGYIPTGNGLADAVLPTEQTQEAPGLDQEQSRFYTLAYYADQGFNPYLCNALNNRMLFSLLYQGLFSVDRNYNAVPILCERFTVSEDLTEFTFYLEDATFSDGTYLRAEDVVASLEYARESDIYEGRFDKIDEIRVVSESAILIETDIPYENLPLLLDIPIVKASQVELPTPVGTGPYAITNTAAGLTLQLRGNWWCKAELPIRDVSIPLFPAENAAQIRDEFEFSDLGLSISDPGAASYAEYRCDYELWEIESGLLVFLCCNTESKVFSNDKVRAALTYAIDRTSILQKCYNGFGMTTTLAVSPNSPFFDRGLGAQGTYAPEKFRQAVKEEGLLGSEVVLLVNKSDSVRVQAARMIVDMLEEAGLVVTLEDWSTPYYKQKLTTDEYDLYLGQTKLSPTMDLSQFFAPYGALSYADLDDASCYSMATEALENSGNFYGLHQLIQADGQLVPVLFRTYGVYAKRGQVGQLNPARDNVFFYTLGKTLQEVMTIETALD
ncbi:MAG: ABC transporter substrate-binding protein [Oscillospiraceae bacterium]|nr:ABC transporter substrate-binding protein [Oscillospiraceae bacterium]MBR2890194.1 ABC transporter substrate-binding protein [Oscillospiraceae bacterium]